MTILGTGTLNSKIFLAKRVLDYILRVCKYYGYSLQELRVLFDSLIMPLFNYAIGLANGLYAMVKAANINP